MSNKEKKPDVKPPMPSHPDQKPTPSSPDIPRRIEEPPKEKEVPKGSGL